MLNLMVDEGYAYDFLSILHIKTIKKICDQSLFEKYSHNLESQVGHNLHKSILESNEYSKCIQINENIFNMVDLAKSDKVTSSIVYNLNYDRYLAKLELQKIWFPLNEITERKN